MKKSLLVEGGLLLTQIYDAIAHAGGDHQHVHEEAMPGPPPAPQACQQSRVDVVMELRTGPAGDMPWPAGTKLASIELPDYAPPIGRVTTGVPATVSGTVGHCHLRVKDGPRLYDRTYTADDCPFDNTTIVAGGIVVFAC